MPEPPRTSTPVVAAAAVEVCGRCREPFVVPVEILSVVRPWRYEVQLACSNCGWTGVQVHDEPALERLDRALDGQARQIRAAIEVLAVSRELDRIDRFAAALARGLVLPEDF